MTDHKDIAVVPTPCSPSSSGPYTATLDIELGR